MPSRYIICFLISLLPFLLNSCGTVGPSSRWIAFTDSLGTGSDVQPSNKLINWRGEAEVSMTKAANPKWIPNKNLDYPYAGIMMMFRPSGETMDISAATGVSLEYRSEGSISLLLAQKDIHAGREYRLDLPPQEDFAVVNFSWKEFKQPSWVDTPTTMNLKKMVSLMFTNSSKEQATVRLTVRQISFPGWIHPDSLQSMIKWLRPEQN